MENRLTPKYCQRVFVVGTDELGHKELFNDFVGDFVCVTSQPQYLRDVAWGISDGVSIHYVHPSQVFEILA